MEFLARVNFILSNARFHTQGFNNFTALNGIASKSLFLLAIECIFLQNTLFLLWLFGFKENQLI